MTKKIITGIISLLFVLSVKAQEALIVRGYLERPSISVSNNFQKNMYCYLKGNFIISDISSFSAFRVDSVISGSFLNFSNDVNKPPFIIKLGLINECTILDYRQNYTLRIKQFPHTNYYYIDSLSQVFPNEKYSDKLAEYYKNYLHNIDILTKGTLQERHNFLDTLQQSLYPANYIFKYKDYRYISYIIPFMVSKDTIINYGNFFWDGYDSKGNMSGGTEIYEEKGLYADFLYNYIDKTLPFALPDKTTDTIGWQNWYDSICHSPEFTPVKYVQSEQKSIANIGTTANYISYFIPDVLNRKIYFASDRNAYSLNINTDELMETPLPKNCKTVISNCNFSIQNNEIPALYTYDNTVTLYTLKNNAFCEQEKFSVELGSKKNQQYNYNLIIHNGKDFYIFWSDNPDGYNYLKAGKINRKGEWIISPKNLYNKSVKSYIYDNKDIGTFSFCQSDKNETILVFSDKTYKSRTYTSGNEVIFIYKINSNLEVTDSVMIPFKNSDFYNTILLKNDNTYLLVAWGNNNLYYKVLNDNLTSKTDFVKLAYNNNGMYPVSAPIVTSEGFMLSWIDNDVSEGILRSVLIDKLGKHSDIINITNKKVENIYNVEFDTNNVDIYLFNGDEKKRIRKRINKEEYNL